MKDEERQEAVASALLSILDQFGDAASGNRIQAFAVVRERLCRVISLAELALDLVPLEACYDACKDS